MTKIINKKLFQECKDKLPKDIFNIIFNYVNDYTDEKNKIIKELNIPMFVYKDNDVCEFYCELTYEENVDKLEMKDNDGTPYLDCCGRQMYFPIYHVIEFQMSLDKNTLLYPLGKNFIVFKKFDGGLVRFFKKETELPIRIIDVIYYLDYIDFTFQNDECIFDVEKNKDTGIFELDI